MKSKILCRLCFFILSLVIVFSSGALPAFAGLVQNESIFVTLNGAGLSFDQPPVIVNGRTLVPLRAIFEAMGATVDWDQDTQTVMSGRGETSVSLTIGSNILYKNGSPIELDVPAQVVNDRTLVPVRAIAEAYDAVVDWDQDAHTVIISYDAGNGINDRTDLHDYFNGEGAELYYLPDDYDRDGKREAFMITGTYDPAGELCDNVRIYFISSAGDCELVASDLYGYRSDVIDTGDRKFIVWELDARGSGSLSYVYGVRNGKCYEPDISGKYMAFRSQDGLILGVVQDFEEGHRYLDYIFTYDSNSGEFTKGDFYGSWF